MATGSKTSDNGKPGEKPSTGPVGRQDRLKAALKANLARRKAQVRVRAQADKNDKNKD